MGSYFTVCTKRVRVGDLFSETIYCHSGVPQGSHLGPLFLIDDINDVLGIFENVRVLAYAGDCRLFQKDLDRLQGWCLEKKYYLNAGKCKFISFSRGSKPVVFQYVIGDSDFERADVNGELVDSKMTSAVSKSARMWGFIK
jgi:hypothetical protein